MIAAGTATLLRLLSLSNLYVLLCVLSPMQAQTLIGHWPLDGNASDASGNGNHGTVSSASLIEDRFGNANSAYRFDGLNSQVVVPSSPIFASLQRWTLSAWIKMCDPLVQVIGLVFAKDSSWGIGFARATDRAIYMTVSGSSIGSLTGANVITRNGKWHHLVCTIDSVTLPSGPGTRTMFYIDGVQLLNLTYTGGSNSGPATPLYIGKFGSFSFNGDIDDARFYDAPLSSTQVQALYNQGNWPNNTYPAATISLTALGPSVFCPGDSTQLQAVIGGSARQFRWQPANGLKSADSMNPRPVVRPGVTTTYIAIASSREPCPDKRDTHSITITVHDPPKPSLGGVRYLCRGDTTQLEATITGGTAPFQYSWTPGITIDAPTSTRPRVWPRDGMIYYLTVTDANGCKGRDSVFITVYLQPGANAGKDTSVCRGSEITIGTSGSSENRYAWSPHAGLSDTTLAQPPTSPDTTTRYYLTVTSPSGCKAYDTIVVTVKDAAKADAGRDTVLCAGGSVVLGSASSGGYTYEWTPPAGLSSPTAARPSATPTITTTYYLTATNAAGCEARDSVTVTVLKPAFSVDKPKLDFGTLDDCTSTKELELTLSNTGENDLRITDVTSAGFSIISPSRPIDLKAGASTKVVVRFAPTGSGGTNGTLLLRGEPCDIELTVDLRGSKDQSDIAASVGSLDFGKRLTCDVIDSTIEVTITNSSRTDATLKPSVLNVPFSATAASTVVPAGQTVTVRVRYQPTAAGSYSDDLKLPYESGACKDTLRIALSGLVEKPALVPEGATIEFGVLSSCETGRDTTITLRNDGVFDITIDGSNLPAGFKIIGTAPRFVAAGTSVTLRLRYEPATSGPSSGDLVLSFDPCDGELRILLSGTKQGVSFALPDTVDFGQLIDCRETSQVQKLQISYSGDAGSNGSIKSVVVSGPFSSTMTAGSALNNGTPTSFDVTFTPTTDGVVTGYIDLVLEPCGVARRIALRGTRASAKLTSQSVSFSIQPFGASTSQPVLFVNTGTSPLPIDRVDGLAAPFSLAGTTPAIPTTLQPGDSLRVDVQYTAIAGESIDTVLAHLSQPCVLVSNAEVRGTGESGAVAVIALPTLTATAGERIRLPLLLQSSANLDVASARDFTAVISFNRSLLIPVEKLGMSVDATTRRVTVTGTRGISDTLAVVPMTVMLGTAPTTPLTLESLTWTGATGVVATRLVDGELTLSDICYIGGARLIDGSGEVMLKPATPNPATGMVEIEYAIVEDGMTQLYVVDASGQRVATVVEAMQPGGRYLTHLETSGLAIGSYFCVLRTPTQMLVQKLEVRK